LLCAACRSASFFRSTNEAPDDDDADAEEEEDEDDEETTAGEGDEDRDEDEEVDKARNEAAPPASTECWKTKNKIKNMCILHEWRANIRNICITCTVITEQ
jgi:hypothetical protein